LQEDGKGRTPGSIWGKDSLLGPKESGGGGGGGGGEKETGKKKKNKTAGGGGKACEGKKRKGQGKKIRKTFPG